jgi:hypothetical protein
MTQAIQAAKILGAGLATLASVFLPRGGQGIALGRYLLAQGASWYIDSPVKLSLFYPSKQVEEVAKNPTRAYLHGHLWDLAHKVLAATAFLTSSDLLIPGSLKIAVWARVFFSLVPVVLKLMHWGLDLASIKGRYQNGIIESCKDTAYNQYEMQQIRLAIMLLCLNLRRLDRNSAKYDVPTMQKIQKFLYLQALYYPYQLIADFENGVERRILQCYHRWKIENTGKRPTTSEQQQAKETIAQDPFFEPLRRMIPHMTAIGLQKFIPELQDLFLVLENLLLSKNHQRIPQVFKTDKTLYSTVGDDAATKTLEEIIQICQQS